MFIVLLLSGLLGLSLFSMDLIGMDITADNSVPSICDAGGNTPLHRACKNGLFEKVRQLVKRHRQNPNVQNYKGVTPVMLAAHKGYLSIVKFLLEEAHADPYMQDNQGVTLVYYALPYLCIVRYLVEELYLPLPSPELAPTSLLRCVLSKQPAHVRNYLVAYHAATLPSHRFIE